MPLVRAQLALALSAVVCLAVSLLVGALSPPGIEPLPPMIGLVCPEYGGTCNLTRFDSQGNRSVVAYDVVWATRVPYGYSYRMVSTYDTATGLYHCYHPYNDSRIYMNDIVQVSGDGSIQRFQWPRELDSNGPFGMQFDRNSGMLFVSSYSGIAVFEAKNLSNWKLIIPNSVFGNETLDRWSGSLAVDRGGQTVFVPLKGALIGAISLGDNLVKYYPAPSNQTWHPIGYAWFQYSAYKDSFYGLSISKNNMPIIARVDRAKCDVDPNKCIWYPDALYVPWFENTINGLVNPPELLIGTEVQNYHGAVRSDILDLTDVNNRRGWSLWGDFYLIGVVTALV